MSDLHDVTIESIGVAAFTALKHYNDERTELASAIINEWTTEDGECLLSHFFDDSIHELEPELMFSAYNEEQHELEFGDYVLTEID